MLKMPKIRFRTGLSQTVLQELTTFPQTPSRLGRWSLCHLSVIYLSLRDKHAVLITQVSSPSLHELMSTNIHSFHVHFSIGILCLLKSVSSTPCLQASQLTWSTKPWHSGGKACKGRRPLLDICQRTEGGRYLAILDTALIYRTRLIIRLGGTCSPFPTSPPHRRLRSLDLRAFGPSSRILFSKVSNPIRVISSHARHWYHLG